MAKAVVGVFQDLTRAKKVLGDLSSAGFEHEATSLVALGGKAGQQAKPQAGPSGLRTMDAPGLGPVQAMGPLADHLSTPDGLIMGLTRLGIPEHDARLYLKHLQTGHSLIEVRARDDRAEEAAIIMSRDGAIPLDEIATGQTTAKARPAPTGRAAQGKDQVREQVVQEEIQVGKREVDRGGVRVFTHITEQPVQEQVTLHEERVDVERRPADRPATAADLSGPAGGEEVVIRERGEEPVVAKQARVVEEVVVSKEAQDRTQTIRDTVRRKDVDVEQIPGRAAGVGEAGAVGGTGMGDFARYEDDFRGHSRSAFAGRGQGYEQLSPAYQYGFRLAGDQRYSGRQWDTIRDQARTDWEQRNPGTWDRIEGAIRYAYEKVRGR